MPSGGRGQLNDEVEEFDTSSIDGSFASDEYYFHPLENFGVPQYGQTLYTMLHITLGMDSWQINKFSIRLFAMKKNSRDRMTTCIFLCTFLKYSFAFSRLHVFKIVISNIIYVFFTTEKVRVKQHADVLLELHVFLLQHHRCLSKLHTVGTNTLSKKTTISSSRYIFLCFEYWSILLYPVFF